MDSLNAPPVEGPATASHQASVWEDFMDIFYAPAQVFRRRAGGNFWIPLMVVTLLMTVLAFANRNVMLPIMDAEFARTAPAVLRANPNLTMEMLQRGKNIGFLAAMYGTVVLVPIMALLFAFVAWALAWLFDGRISWNAAMVIACYGLVPRVVQGIVLSMQGLLMDPASLVSRFSIEVGPGRLADPATVSPLVGALYDHTDLFVLWTTVLVTIGVATIGKIPKLRALAFGAAFWVATMSLALYQAWKLT